MNISYSAISCFKQCKYKFMRQYIDKEPIDNKYLRIGRLVHDAISKYLKNELMLDSIDKYIDDNSYNIYEANESKAILSIETLESIIAKLELHDRTFESELLIEVELDGINYKGFIDVYLEHKLKKDIISTIVDFKTSKNYKYIDWEQFLFYSFLLYFKYKSEGKDIPNKYNFVLYPLRYNILKTSFVDSNNVVNIYDSVMEVTEQIFNEKHYYPTKNVFCIGRGYRCMFYNECPIFLKLY